MTQEKPTKEHREFARVLISSPAQVGYENVFAEGRASISLDETRELTQCSLSPLFDSTSPSASTCYESASQSPWSQSSSPLAEDILVFQAMQLKSPPLQNKRAEITLSSVESVKIPRPDLLGEFVFHLQEGNERRSEITLDPRELQSIQQKRIIPLLESSRSTAQNTEARKLEFDSEDCHNEEVQNSGASLERTNCRGNKGSGASCMHNYFIEAGCVSQSFKNLFSNVLSKEESFAPELYTLGDEPRPAFEGNAVEVRPDWGDNQSSDISTLTEKLLKTEGKCTALTKLVHVQRGMLQTLQLQVLREQAAHEEAQENWDSMSRQQEDELAALQAILASACHSGLASGLLVAEIREKAEAELQTQELQAAVSEARVEVVEAEQERFECEQWAKRRLEEASATLQQEREAAVAQMDQLTTLLSTARAREETLIAECTRHLERAEKAEARAAELDNAMHAAKALWVEGQRTEQDREETIAFLEGQLAVAQTQVKIAKLRHSEGQAPESSLQKESERASFYASGEIVPEARPQQYDEKENTGQEPAPLPMKADRNGIGKRGLRKSFSRILPLRTGLTTSFVLVKDSVEEGKIRRKLTDRKALGDLTNT